MLRREVIFLRKNDNACTHYRVIIPAKHLQQKGIKVSLVNSASEIDLSNVQNKIYIFGRSCLYTELDVFREIKKRGGIVVYEIDDDLLDLPSWNPASAFFLKVQVVIRNFLREADLVIVTTEALKNSFRKFNSNISVIDNYIDFEHESLNILPNITNKLSHKVSIDDLTGRFFLLWGGSITHRVDLKILEKPLAVFFKKYPEAGLVAIHTLNRAFFNALRPDQLFLVSAVPPKYYLSLLKLLPANIGVAPLANYPFNLCKSRLKVIEYMAAGLVPLSSKIGAYAQTLGPTVYGSFLCTNDEWLPKLENAHNFWEFKIIRDSVTSYAKRNFDISNSNWEEVLSSL